MFYVGIDIAKRSHVACVMRDDNSLEIRPFEFQSTKGGFEKLKAQLSSLACDVSEVLIGMEATGLLFDNLYRFLQSLHYRVVLLNPYALTVGRKCPWGIKQRSLERWIP